MQGAFLLIWFWLMMGCVFNTTSWLYYLYEGEKWYKKMLFWPYYLVVYYIHYIKVCVPDVYYFFAYQAWKITH